MIEYNTLISITILILNILTVVMYLFSVSIRLKFAIGAKNRSELDFYFKLIMMSVIGALMGGISFYIGLNIWLKVNYLSLTGDDITVLRLVFAVLMGVRSGLMLILDENYNPFRVK